MADKEISLINSPCSQFSRITKYLKIKFSVHVSIKEWAKDKTKLTLRLSQNYISRFYIKITFSRQLFQQMLNLKCLKAFCREKSFPKHFNYQKQSSRDTKTPVPETWDSGTGVFLWIFFKNTSGGCFWTFTLHY